MEAFFESKADCLDQLILGDAKEILSTLPEGCVDLVVTSPPYWTAVEYEEPTVESAGTYQEYLASLLAVWKECFRVLRPNGKIAINSPIMPIPKKIVGGQHTRHLKNINNDIEFTILSETAFLRYSLFVWQKQTSKLMFGSYPHPGNILENNTIEFINVFVKPGKPPKFPKPVKKANEIPQDEWIDLTQQVWFMYPEDVKREGDHPAPFPEKLPARLIRMYTYGATEDFGGEVVLDPFCGTGTACAVAKRMGRRFIGVDIVESYLAHAQERVNVADGQGAPVLWVGRPKYPGKAELDEMANSVQRVDKKAANPAKHRRETYGRSTQEKPQLGLL